MSLASVLTKVADITLSKSGRAILSSLGLGLATSSISLVAFNQYINYLQKSYSALGDVANIMALGGIDYGLSIIISAIVIKLSLKVNSISLARKR